VNYWGCCTWQHSHSSATYFGNHWFTAMFQIQPKLYLQCHYNKSSPFHHFTNDLGTFKSKHLLRHFCQNIEFHIIHLYLLAGTRNKSARFNYHPKLKNHETVIIPCQVVIFSTVWIKSAFTTGIAQHYFVLRTAEQKV